ncbi:MAG: hypothetical protein L3J95_04255 [Thermoplasmata archaeon]|nr:hypothetical protein [Thermoplasmata archaeon]MCI4359619.1 hypothetical protein [Thermoplasmata archaeon]
MSIDIAVWTFVGTWTLVIGTIVLMWWQTRQTRILNSANVVMALRERFASLSMRRARRFLATRLLNNQHEDITNLEVGAFFELVGALTHRGVLEEDLVWEAFGTWAADYYHALRHPVDLIGQARSSLRDPLLFHEFEWLHDRVLHLDRANLGSTHAETIEDEEEIRILLKREGDLDIEV